MKILGFEIEFVGWRKGKSWKQYVKEGNKLEAIKVYRRLHDVTLMQAKCAVEVYQQKRGYRV